MRSLLKIALAMSIVLPYIGAANVAHDPVKEPWSFGFDGRKWAVGNRRQVGSEAVIEYVLPGETVTNWSELVTSQFIGDMDRFDPEQWLTMFTESMAEKYTTFKWKRYSVKDGSVLFEWQHQGGSQWPAQHEVKRVVKQGRTVYILAYVKKTSKLDDTKREKWIDLLKEATIVQQAEAHNGDDRAVGAAPRRAIKE
jgi:hypothetical protein